MKYVNPKGKTVIAHCVTDDMLLLTRKDGRVERVCKHGVGHPVGHISKWENWMGVHGCCDKRCCTQWAG